jgi:hypothetical protein
MPDARGDVLCPTCGRWTPPAPFCNECGAALQGGFRDPVGGQGSDVFRRGHEVDDPGAPWSGPAERFEPEPEDQAARAAAAAAGAGSGSRVDNLSEAEEVASRPPAWRTEPGLAAEPSRPADEPAAGETAATETPAAATPRKRSRASAPPPVDEPVPPPPVIPPPPPPPFRPAQPPEASGGVSGLVFVLFLGLGILALLGGAIVGGVFDAGPAAEASPSSTIVATPSPEPTPEESSAEASPTTTAAPTVIPSAAQPSALPDGFVARAETCGEEPTGPTCDNSGAENDGELWILVSFRHATASDVIGVSIVDSGGNVEGQSSIPLSFCGASTDCAGYTYFGFNNLDPGDYDVRVTRNGTQVATTSFTVE